MGYGGGSGSGGSGGSGGGSGASGGSGYRRVGDDRTANLKVNNITNRTGTDGTEVDGIVEVNTTAHFIPPSGTTAERGSRGRGVLAGGNDAPGSSYVNTIDYVTIATTGNARDFGDLPTNNSDMGGFASSTHGFFAGGLSPTVLSTITRITTSSTGNAFNFGELDSTYWGGGGLSNATRGIYGGGRDPSASPYTTKIQYFNLASGGKSSFFGNLSSDGITKGTCASTTRGIFFNGQEASPVGRRNIIEYITISTLGNGQDFGDSQVAKSRCDGLSNTVRGVFGGGYLDGSPASVSTNIIDYITIATTGDALDFGDLTQHRYNASGCCTSTRGIFMGGLEATAPTYPRVVTIDYVTIMTTGNALDFGDLTDGRAIGCAVSDSHGGLG